MGSVDVEVHPNVQFRKSFHPICERRKDILALIHRKATNADRALCVQKHLADHNRCIANHRSRWLGASHHQFQSTGLGAKLSALL